MWFFSTQNNYLPRATGPYQPGIVDVHLGYTKDGIFFRLYYPTNKSPSDIEESSYVPFLSDEEYLEGIAKVLLINPILVRLLVWKNGKGMLPVLYGEKAKVKDKMKCVILSHGLGAFRTLYNTIVMELTSRGYIVLCLEHRDESPCFSYYYESKENADKKIKTPIKFKTVDLGSEHFKNRNEQVQRRSEECCTAYKFFCDLNEGKFDKDMYIESNSQEETFDIKDFIGKIDVNNITLMGHSFGGATALLALNKLPQIKCGILLDPWMFPIRNENLHEKIKQPCLFINTQTFHISANVKSLQNFYKSEPNNMFTILKTTHEHQTDTVLLIGSWLNWFMKKINPHKALKINNFLVLKFLKEHVGAEVEEDYDGYLDKQSEDVQPGVPVPWA